MARKTPSTKTVTSRSLTISTPNFCFDLTWRKVEIEVPAPPPADRAAAPHPPGASFAETLRRKQIGQLLGPLQEPEVRAELLPLSLGPLARPSRAEVCDLYQRASHLLPEN
jgi:hypothetical protein